MKPKLYLSVVILLSWCFHMTNGLCENFPYGHLCRNLDLTAFCLQVSNLLRIRDLETIVPPYPQFEKIFNKLKFDAEANKPFVHFGGYKRGNIYPCVIEKCTPPPPPGATTQASVATTSAGPCLPPNNCPISRGKTCPSDKYTPPPCPSGTQKGPPDGTDDKDPAYTGCPEDCECCLVPPDDKTAVGTIFSLQDGCELRYLKAPIEKCNNIGICGGTVYDIPVDGMAKENPYRLNVTQVTVKGVLLHNWLHIRIYSEGNPGLNSDDLGFGKIKLAFIVAHDATGFPVGEFVNTLPCGEECNCRTNDTSHVCHQGTLEDTIPCMFDGKRVTSSTGMMMVAAENDGINEGLDEIHATWRYSQPYSAEHFITELHFIALLVDDYNLYRMAWKGSSSNNVRLSGMSERRVNKYGLFGWNPVYNILHPTVATLGSYDYFRTDVYDQSDVNCHHPIQSEQYIVEPYPDSGPIIRKIDEKEGSEDDHCYRLNNIFQPDKIPVPTQCKVDGGKRSPVRCPGIRPNAKPFYLDGYGFTSAGTDSTSPGNTDPQQIYPWTLFGARTEAYAARDGAVSPADWSKFTPSREQIQQLKVDISSTANLPNVKLYWGIEDTNSLQYEECSGNSDGKVDYYGRAHKFAYPAHPTDDTTDEYKQYGHFCEAGTRRGRRVLNLPGPTDQWPNVLRTLRTFPKVAKRNFFEDRCYCPRIPPTPDPRYREPPEIQVQGRRQHAYQMIIAWNCLLPFGIFVSRYYKETYSKVFFLQEFWWYTIHVMCMVSTAMFTFGGIFIMELKRKEPINWYDMNITVHVVIGYLVIAVFFFQVFSGFFRVKDPRKRMFQIFTHWLLGILEYLLAVFCMVNASSILLSGMTCEGVVAVGFLLLFQVMFYASMEVHMRNVDKQLRLTPPRTYLPPPIMRLFHQDAPDSKFRIQVLIAYFVLCTITSAIQYISMESNTLGESCFIKSKKFVEPDEV